MPRTYKLLKPIQFGENAEPVTQLTIREEVVAGDLRGIRMSQEMLFDDALKLVARLTAQPEALIARMDLLDFQEVAGIVGGFFGTTPGPGTGTTRLPS